jgi:four helix bundle protein
MGVRKFEDLIAWQLSHELQEEVFAFSATRPACFDRKFCDQIRDSARSAPRNIAEGFARYYPKEFIRFLRIAAGSLQETRNHLLDARARGYITTTELERLSRFALSRQPLG